MSLSCGISKTQFGQTKKVFPVYGNSNTAKLVQGVPASRPIRGNGFCKIKMYPSDLKKEGNDFSFTKFEQFLCLLCRHICRRVISIWAINICMYVCMYTRILISDFSVFRTFTSMPINGLNVKF